jgi:hypothetical protein
MVGNDADHNRKVGTMRKMRHNATGTVFKVHGWGMTRNGWEYYFLDNKRGDIREAYVCGIENERGDISLSEVKPYLWSLTFKPTDLRNLAPAPDCSWVD